MRFLLSSLLLVLVAPVTMAQRLEIRLANGIYPPQKMTYRITTDQATRGSLTGDLIADKPVTGIVVDSHTNQPAHFTLEVRGLKNDKVFTIYKGQVTSNPTSQALVTNFYLDEADNYLLNKDWLGPLEDGQGNYCYLDIDTRF
jgi:hypothetical protein